MVTLHVAPTDNFFPEYIFCKKTSAIELYKIGPITFGGSEARGAGWYSIQKAFSFPLQKLQMCLFHVFNYIHHIKNIFGSKDGSSNLFHSEFCTSRSLILSSPSSTYCIAWNTNCEKYWKSDLACRRWHFLAIYLLLIGSFTLMLRTLTMIAKLTNIHQADY